MNPIQTLGSISVSSDIIILRESLNRRIEYGNRCEEFFNLYSRPKPNQANDFPSAHYNYMSHFSKMFSFISKNKLDEWKETYQTIAEKGSIQDELNELKIKMGLAEKTTEAFCRNMINLIQNNARILLLGELNRTGEHIFFLAPLTDINGGIGECQCCDAMNRKNRNIFSQSLLGEIATSFPDKKSISIASIGAGTCFHELEIHALAKKEGYEVTEWTIVDPIIQSKAIKNFTTMVKWATPNTTVTSVGQRAHEYFNGLENSNSAPDVFLFIDVDLHIPESEVQGYAQKLNRACLFAYFAKNQQHGAEYYDSKVYK